MLRDIKVFVPTDTIEFENEEYTYSEPIGFLIIKPIYCAFETKEEFEKYLYKLLGAEYIKELH
ncbi:MAG: hypothetical protein ABI091_26590 [Ferruginibacter sp.]